MSVISKYNKGPRFNYRFDENTEYEYMKLKELNPAEKYLIYSMYINDKSDYDDHPVFAAASVHDQDNVFLADIPSHLTATVREMINDDEIVSLANQNYLGFKIKTYEYEKKENKKTVKKTGYSVEFIDFSSEE